MKLTKLKLKQLIKEELESLSELGEPELKSGTAAAAAKSIFDNPAIKKLVGLLAEKSEDQKAEFIAALSQAIGLESGGADAGKVKTAQARLQKQTLQQATSTAPPGAND